MNDLTIGSVCSGIEAASVAWLPLNFKFKWFSEIATFPSEVLNKKYPNIENLGDMKQIPSKILNDEIYAPDLICGGTPCQAFSFAGLQNGLNDERGNLTLKFIDIIEANDKKRIENNLDRTIVFWENVEGVLKDKTNAFGCFISYLAGFDEVLEVKKWANAGIVRGTKRNVAWRVLDAKYFGLPQQRKRLYVLAGGKDFYPENILFEEKKNNIVEAYPKYDLKFEKGGHKYQVFREYTDCLYSAYGTKWNGNAAAYNGSLFVAQDGKIRRLSPLECERLMGFPDNYTEIETAKNTTRYQAVGNSWAVPVIKWIGNRLKEYNVESSDKIGNAILNDNFITKYDNGIYLDLENQYLIDKLTINASKIPNKCKFATMKDIVTYEESDKLFLSPVGCYGILRRKNERNMNINCELEKYLEKTSLEISLDEIEKKSKIQKRSEVYRDNKQYSQINIFNLASV